MLNLAIECSGSGGGIALLREQELIAESSLAVGAASLQSLASSLDALLAAQGRRQVDLISVTVGPGSFTGLRVGLATAKMLGFAWGTPLVPVDTLHVIAWGIASQQIGKPAWTANPRSISLVSVLNAFRKQVFAGAWLLDKSSTNAPVLLPLAPSQVLDAAQWQAEPLRSLLTCQLSPDTCSLVCGPGLRNYSPTAALELADESCWDPTAAAVGMLGWQAFAAGSALSARELRPNYIRASAAEEAAGAK